MHDGHAVVNIVFCASRHVIEIQEIGFKKFGTELRKVVGFHQILAGNVITCLEPCTTKLLMLFQVLASGVVITLEIGLTVTE